MPRDYGRVVFPRDFKTKFGKYDRIVDRTLDEIPDGPSYKSIGSLQAPKGRSRMPRRTTYGRKPSAGRRTYKKRPTYKRKRLSTKRKIRKSTKKRKVSKKSKSVTLTVGTTRTRLVHHESQTRHDAHYTTFSATGGRTNFLSIIAQATLLHYMHRVGDYRASKDMNPVDPPSNQGDFDQLVTWDSMSFQFMGVNGGSEGYRYSLTQAGGGINRSLQDLTTVVSGYFRDQFKEGRRLASVAVMRGSECVLMDVNAGRNIIEFTSSAKMKLQNVTPADHGEANDMNNIHRNPLDGYAYKFKNQVPQFKYPYLISKTDLDRRALDEVSQVTDIIEGCLQPDFAGIGGAPEFKSPPVAPTTIFKNVAGKTKTRIGVGGHRTYYLKEYYKGALNSFADRYIRTETGSVEQPVPPGSSCMMVGLKPTYRTSNNEDIKLEKEFSYMYTARMSKAKLTPLPMNTVLLNDE